MHYAAAPSRNPSGRGTPPMQAVADLEPNAGFTSPEAIQSHEDEGPAVAAPTPRAAQDNDAGCEQQDSDAEVVADRGNDPQQQPQSPEGLVTPFELDSRVSWSRESVQLEGTFLTGPTFSDPGVELEYKRFLASRGRRSAGTLSIVLGVLMMAGGGLSRGDALQTSVWVVGGALYVAAGITELVVCEYFNYDSIDEQITRAVRHHMIQTVGWGAPAILIRLGIAIAERICVDWNPRFTTNELACVRSYRAAHALLALLTAIFVHNPRHAAIAILFQTLMDAADPVVRSEHADDFAFRFALSCILAVLCILMTIHRDRTDRHFFVVLVDQHNCRDDLLAQRQTLRVVVRAAVPRRLLKRLSRVTKGLGGEIALGDLVDHTTSGVVVVTSAVSFGVNATATLLRHTIHAMHALTTIFDTALNAFDLDHGTATGDCYVATTGLLRGSRVHLLSVLRFAWWQVTLAMPSVAKLPLHSIVHCGALRSAVVGTSSLRYVVSGPALSSALDAIDGVPSGGLWVSNAAIVRYQLPDNEENPFSLTYAGGAPLPTNYTSPSVPTASELAPSVASRYTSPSAAATRPPTTGGDSPQDGAASPSGSLQRIPTSQLAPGSALLRQLSSADDFELHSKIGSVSASNAATLVLPAGVTGDTSDRATGAPEPSTTGSKWTRTGAASSWAQFDAPPAWLAVSVPSNTLIPSAAGSVQHSILSLSLMHVQGASTVNSQTGGGDTATAVRPAETDQRQQDHHHGHRHHHHRHGHHVVPGNGQTPGHGNPLDPVYMYTGGGGGGGANVQVPAEASASVLKESYDGTVSATDHSVEELLPVGTIANEVDARPFTGVQECPGTLHDPSDEKQFVTYQAAASVSSATIDFGVFAGFWLCVAVVAGIERLATPNQAYGNSAGLDAAAFALIGVSGLCSIGIAVYMARFRVSDSSAMRLETVTGGSDRDGSTTANDGSHHRQMNERRAGTSMTGAFASRISMNPWDDDRSVHTTTRFSMRSARSRGRRQNDVKSAATTPSASRTSRRVTASSARGEKSSASKQPQSQASAMDVVPTGSDDDDDDIVVRDAVEDEAAAAADAEAERSARILRRVQAAWLVLVLAVEAALFLLQRSTVTNQSQFVVFVLIGPTCHLQASWPWTVNFLVTMLAVVIPVNAALFYHNARLVLSFSAVFLGQIGLTVYVSRLFSYVGRTRAAARLGTEAQIDAIVANTLALQAVVNKVVPEHYSKTALNTLRSDTNVREAAGWLTMPVARQVQEILDKCPTAKIDDFFADFVCLEVQLNFRPPVPRGGQYSTMSFSTTSTTVGSPATVAAVGSSPHAAGKADHDVPALQAITGGGSASLTQRSASTNTSSRAASEPPSHSQQQFDPDSEVTSAASQARRMRGSAAVPPTPTHHQTAAERRRDHQAAQKYLARWSTLESLLEDVGQSNLHLLTVVGDRFVVGGPFGQTDALERKAVVGCVNLLRGLVNLMPDAGFTAVGIIEEAFGALVGECQLRYRVFGIAPLQCSALLQAAVVTQGSRARPPTGMPAAAALSVPIRTAFFSRRFAQQAAGAVSAVARDAANAVRVKPLQPQRWRTVATGVTRVYPIAFSAAPQAKTSSNAAAASSSKDGGGDHGGAGSGSRDTAPSTQPQRVVAAASPKRTPKTDVSGGQPPPDGEHVMDHHADIPSPDTRFRDQLDGADLSGSGPMEPAAEQPLDNPGDDAASRPVAMME